MKLKDLVEEVYARTITIIEDHGGITEFGANGWGYQYTIQRACKEFGERDVMHVCDMGNLETVIMVA